MSIILRDAGVRMGSPVRARGIAVAPLFLTRRPRARYITLDEAVPRGLRIDEVHDDGVVGELRVVNGSGENVLIYDGEELVGAKQNRIPDRSVLAAAGAHVTIPVSCVERGRWSSRSASFSTARHASNPDLRARRARRLAQAGAEPERVQAEVWAAVADASGRLGVSSPTDAQADAFDGRRADLERLAAAFPVQAGQCGAVLALAGRPVCLDLLSRPEAFALLYPKLLSGYLLDALGCPKDDDVSDDDLAGFLEGTLACPARRGPTVGLGEDLRLAGDGVVGSGLALEGEVIQLSAYAISPSGW